MLTGGTDVHLVLADLRDSELDGQQAEDRLHEIGITVNRNAVPFDPRPPAVSSGLRIGTPALATRGLQADDFPRSATSSRGADAGDFSDDQRAELSQRTRALAERYPLYPQLGSRQPFRRRRPARAAALAGHRIAGRCERCDPMDELDALWAFLVAAAIAVRAHAARRPVRPPRRRGATSRATATCTTTTMPGAGRAGDPGRRAGRGAGLPARQPRDARDRRAARSAIALVGAMDDIPSGLPPLVKLVGQFARGRDPGLSRRAVDELHAPVHRPGRARATGASR